MASFRVNPNEHQFHETEVVGFLRKELNDPDLFTARNLRTGEWFLGYWMDRTRGWAVDIRSMGSGILPELTKEVVANLKKTREGATHQLLRKHYEDKIREQERLEAEEQLERDEVLDWWQQRSGSETPLIFG